MATRRILAFALAVALVWTAAPPAAAAAAETTPTAAGTPTDAPTEAPSSGPTPSPAPLPPLTLDEALSLLHASSGVPETSYADRLAQWASFPAGTGGASADPEDPDADVYGYSASDAVKATVEGGSAMYRFTVPALGLYEFRIDYLASDRNLTDNTISVTVDDAVPFDEAAGLDLPALYQDESKTFALDRYGNETVPRTVVSAVWQTRALRTKADATARPLRFLLAAGEHVVRIDNRANPLVFGRLSVSGATDRPTYAEYRAASPQAGLYEGAIALRAVDYASKNSSYINLASIPNPDLEPFASGRNSMNAIDEIGFKYPGQEVTFAFDAPETAYYRLSFLYASTKEDDPACRGILVDGETPFAELASVPFPATSGKWRTLELADAAGTPYEIFLTKGAHALTLRVEAGLAAAGAERLDLVLQHIGVLTQRVRRITGKDVDVNRTWKLSQYIPDVGRCLEAYGLVFGDVLASLAPRSPKGARSAGLADLVQAMKKTARMAEKPDELPLRLNMLQEASGSVAELLGLENEKLLAQPMSLNAIYVHGAGPVPDTRKSFWTHLTEGVRAFFRSFSPSAATKSETKKPDRVTVWVNRAVQQVDLIQKLADSRFTEETGIRVDISQMSNEGRLVLAKASGSSPDAVLGISGWLPYELAIRGAGYDLTRFPDFWTFAGQFAPGAFVPLMIDGKAYAMPESMDFQCLFYRKDILGSLGLPVPDTWNDVIDLLPELQRAGLGFYHQMAVNSSYKWFNITYIDLAQFGAPLYSADGTRVNLTSKEAVAALDFQTKLFTTYSMPEQVASFYQSFRNGTIPIGVGSFATYVQLKSAAPEIAGRWGMAPLPGQVDAQGDVARWTPGLSSTAFLFGDTALPEESWKFLKWWLSAETQTDFAYLLQSTFGPTYMWLPANLAAVDAMPVEAADRAVIRAQLDWIAEPPKTPATYMVERGLSDVWNSVVFDGVPVRVAIDRMQISADRELRRKLIEFGYIADGVVVKPYVLPTVQEIRAEMEKHADD